MTTTFNGMQKGEFPSNTEVNPIEYCKAVTLRSGRQLQDLGYETIEEPIICIEKKDNSKETVKEAPPTLEAEKPLLFLLFLTIYPQCFQKKTVDAQFKKFLDIFKKLNINISFANALEQMPNYVKFMKEMLSNKKKFKKFETIHLVENFNVRIQRKLPQKLKDLEGFSIPCNLGSYGFRGLCDLGVNINSTPLSLCRKLNIGEIKRTSIMIQLVDRSTAHPYGVIENVLIKVGKFILPVDFYVMDVEENHELHVILGRPFMATG
ncbi:uncharacterized protein LOC111023979 [Momordica charantia]|uniref:Uncharacterized protein LOC111023979 n=1 Tax=Momordica charantia TaxID=3673 RepID=A0A6J1DTZ8_MOMCH|nr:uncharacterized protein LOC111023979 [Momordica charantia]